MVSDNAQRVSDLLLSSVNLLERAAGQIRQYAARAANGDAGSPEDGLGHHFLVAQALNEVHNATRNMPLADAFAAAADADRP